MTDRSNWRTYAVRDQKGDHVGPYYTAESREKVEELVYKTLDQRWHMVVTLTGPRGPWRGATVID